MNSSPIDFYPPPTVKKTEASACAFFIFVTSRNHNRVYRIALNLRIKPSKRMVRETPKPLIVPNKTNECWSMDFMHDQLSDGRSCRLFNVIDDFNREALAIDADLSLPSARVIRSLNQIIEWRGKPKIIRCDNGPEYISQQLKDWADKNRIELSFIQPGNPQQNAYIERFNRTVRYDWLEQYLFTEIEELQEQATRWLWTYNNERPNMALGGIAPLSLSMYSPSQFFGVNKTAVLERRIRLFIFLSEWIFKSYINF